MKIKNFKIFLVWFFIFTFSLPLAYAIEEEWTGWTTWPLKNKENMYIYNKNANWREFSKYLVDNYLWENETEEALKNSTDILYAPSFNEPVSLHNIIYRYVKPNWEVIVFDNWGNYSNISTWESFRNLFFNKLNVDFSSSQANSYVDYNIIDHNDFIIFIQKETVWSDRNNWMWMNIYSKKLNKFINISLWLYHNLASSTVFSKNNEMYWALHNLFYWEGGMISSYSILWDWLMLYFYNWNDSFTYNRKWLLLSFYLTFSSLTDDLFNNNSDKLFLPWISFKETYFNKINPFLSRIYWSQYNYQVTSNFKNDNYWLKSFVHKFSDDENTRANPKYYVPTGSDYSYKMYYVNLDNINNKSFFRNWFLKNFNETSWTEIKSPIWFTLKSSFVDESVNITNSFINSNIRLRSWGVLFLKNWIWFYTNNNSWISYAYNTSSWSWEMAIKDIWWKFLNFFRNYKILDFWQTFEKWEQKYFISYSVNWQFRTIKFSSFQNLEDWENFQDKDILNWLFYLWSIWNKNSKNPLLIYWDQSLNYLQNFDNTKTFPTFFIWKYKGELRFFYISNSWKLYIWNSDIIWIWKKYNIEWNNYFFDVGNNTNQNWNINNWWIWEAWADWNYEKEEGLNYEKEKKEKAEFEENKKNAEKTKQEFNKFLWDNEFVKKILNLINFWFPENWNTKLTIPYIVPKIENWRAKVWYEEKKVNLNPIEDKLKINALWEDDWTWKKIISFFLAFIYITVKLILIFLPVFFISYIFKITIWLKDIFLPFLQNKEMKGNIWTAWVLIWFILLFWWLFLWFIWTIDFVFSFFSYVKDIINLIFWFLNYNFFSFNTFTSIIWFFDWAIVSLFIAYVWLTFVTSFWKVN